MDDLEIGYAQVEKLNPRCVMASSQLLGSRGVWADWLGYGPSTQPIGGLVHLWNYTDQEFPAGSGAIFPDHLAGRLVALVALAALLRRQRTDHGGHGEVAQCEAVTGILGDLLLKTGLAPGSVKPTGGRSDRGAPWGAFPCVGDQQWVVISIRDDDDWKMLRMALGEPEWAMDPALEDARERFARQDEIESHLTEWTSSRTREDVTATLQMMKVPAAPMFTATDQICDPHYQARGYPHWIDQQDLGWICMEGPAFHAPEMGRVRIEQAPKLGEHTRKICRELLDMNGEAIEELVANGALEVPND